MRRFCPAEIKLILHYYACPEEPPTSPINSELTKMFLEEGLIELCDELEVDYQTTDKGDAWVRMICNTPYPEMAWLNPETNKLISL